MDIEGEHQAYSRGKLRYHIFVNTYNDKMEQGGINGLTPSEIFLQTFSRSHNRNKREKCHLCDI